MNIKKIILCLLVIAVALPLSSQMRSTPTFHKKSYMGMGLEIAYLQPDKTSLFGFQWKAAPDISLAFRTDINRSRWRLGGSLGYAPFLPTRKSFPIWQWWDDLNGDIVFFGESTHSTGHYLHLGVFGEYKFLKTAVSPFVGLETIFGGFFYTEKNTFYETGMHDPGSMFDGEESYMNFGFYLIPKAGVVYDLEDKMSFLLSAGVHLRPGVSPVRISYTFFTVSLSAIYYF